MSGPEVACAAVPVGEAAGACGMRCLPAHGLSDSDTRSRHIRVPDNHHSLCLTIVRVDQIGRAKTSEEVKRLKGMLSDAHAKHKGLHHDDHVDIRVQPLGCGGRLPWRSPWW
eukprot:2346180-Rhodomonas_salina.8